MSQTHSIQLSETIYRALLNAARSKGTTPEAFIAESLPPASSQISTEDRHLANLRLRQNIVSLGYTTGSDNEIIDADLAREYDDNHSTLALP